MSEYKENETATISLGRYEELKDAERRYEALKECFDIFPAAPN